MLFRFRPDVSVEHKSLFVSELKTLKSLPCVQDGRLIVGGPSVTDPIERSKGFEIALLSYHRDREALTEYQSSKEHHRCVITQFMQKGKRLTTSRITSTYMFPFKEDLIRFDFEVDSEDEYMCQGIGSWLARGLVTPQEDGAKMKQT